MCNDTHSALVLKVTDTGVILVDGNYGKVVKWGRRMSFKELKKYTNYYLSRYPQ